jgi:predicted transcriptional regulator
MSHESIALDTLLQRPLVTIDTDMCAAHALAAARTHHVHHLPVMLDGTLVGLACTCNLEAAAPATRVETLMSRPAVTIACDATFGDAVAAMNEHDIGSVILVKEGQPCGIVTRGDLLLAQPELCDQLEKSRCECCGLTRHLSLAPNGQTLCVYCCEPGADGKSSHMSTD